MVFDRVKAPLILFNMEKNIKINEILSICLSLFLLFSCGKSLDNKEKDTNGAERDSNGSTIPIPMGKFFSSQSLKCEDPLLCPDNIAKIVVVVDNKIRYCTGTLIDTNKILTSASCLPKAIRIPRISCNENIVAVFPKTIYSKEEIVACDKIEYVDENLFVEPALWQNDLVVLRLGRNVQRSFYKISLSGVEDKEEVKGWSVKYKTETAATLKPIKCQTVLNTFLNPFSVSKFSSMVVLNRCDLDEGSVGTAFLRGEEIVSVYSQEMSERLYSYFKNGDIMQGELSRYYHSSNVSCSNLNIASFVPGISKDCFVTRTTKTLDKKRARILEKMDIHQEAMAEILESVELPSKYFLWNVSFRETLKAREFELFLSKPKCINNSGEWIYEYRTWRRRIRTYARVQFNLPRYTIKTKLNSDLKTVSEVHGPFKSKHSIEFNPFNAYVNKNTYVKLSSWENGIQNSTRFDDVKSDCVSN